MIDRWMVASIAGYGECAFFGTAAGGDDGFRLRGAKLTKIVAHPQLGFAFMKAKEGAFNFPHAGFGPWMDAPPEWIELLEKTWSSLVLK